MPTQIRLVIFDLDGTLINAYPAITASFNYTMIKLGYPPKSASVIRGAVGWGDKRLLEPFIKKKDLKRAVCLYRRHHKISLTRRSRVFTGVNKLLSSLRKKGYILAVASNRPTKFSWILLRHLKLDQYFDYVICADKIKRIKPDPDILNIILRKFRLTKEEALYVGDMAIDAQAGRASGIKTIIVTTGSSSHQEIKREKPHAILSKVNDLARVL